MVPKTTWLSSRLLLLGAAALVAAASPALAGVFHEGFEDGTLGAMAPMNIDAGKASLEDSDGYRCQYSDPDWVNSNSYVPPPPGQGKGKGPANIEESDCYLGATALQADAFFWHVVDGYDSSEEGRSYTGHYSVRMGAISASGHLTAPAAVLEALVTASPIRIAGDAASPELSFKHQISLPDYRVVNSLPGFSADGGVVQALALSAGGQPQGAWTTLTPLANGYDEQRWDNWYNCFFDPIDDGNDEDDFYDPEDPLRRLGPSSLCYDQWVFVWMGDTDMEFGAPDPDENDNLGNAAGPGLQGATGLGTWVESRFDLSPYRGKDILIRFINSSIKVQTYETYESFFGWNPTPGDDGWWIDDITVTGTLDEADTLDADIEDVVAPAADRRRFLEARPAP